MRILFGCLIFLALVGCTSEKSPTLSKPPSTANAATPAQTVEPADTVFKNPSNGSTGPTTSVTRDLGGYMSEYIREAQYAAANNVPVAIRGACYSACAIKLSSGPNLCVHPQAVIGIHEVRRVPKGKKYAQSVRNDEATERYRNSMPECAAELFESKKAFSSARMTTFSGREVLKACPQIKPCPN
jgi:hypothetical protein